jgi:hypothetical protein
VIYNNNKPKLYYDFISDRKKSLEWMKIMAESDDEMCKLALTVTIQNINQNIQSLRETLLIDMLKVMNKSIHHCALLASLYVTRRMGIINVTPEIIQQKIDELMIKYPDLKELMEDTINRSDK